MSSIYSGKWEVIILSPHVEVRCQSVVVGGGTEITFGTHWVKVPDTEHKTGDTESENARKAHDLLKRDIKKYREMKDKKGGLCDYASVLVSSKHWPSV
jgi:hypothetical protein